MKRVWPDWIQQGVLNLVLADAGVGRTRFVADLVRRVRHGLPWPDCKPMNAPAGAKVLWVVADLHHAELVKLCTDFDIVGAVKVNADRRVDVFGGNTVDTPKDIADLERRVRAVKPLFVVVDTVNGSTLKNLCRPEDAILYFAPLQAIAQRQETTFLALHHTNLTGGAVGRRVMERVRCCLKLEDPDPENQPKRRRLEVSKSSCLKPSPLGVTMGDKGNEYDRNPPTKASQEPGRPGPQPAKYELCVKWLTKFLGPTPKRVSITRSEAEKADFSAKLLYRARDDGLIEEFEAEGKKWWRLMPKEDGE
jgi:hypothetical protein